MKKKAVKIELTPEQQEQIREATGKDRAAHRLRDSCPVPASS
jgi:hypothetical protein